MGFGAYVLTLDAQGDKAHIMRKKLTKEWMPIYLPLRVFAAVDDPRDHHNDRVSKAHAHMLALALHDNAANSGSLFIEDDSHWTRGRIIRALIYANDDWGAAWDVLILSARKPCRGPDWRNHTFREARHGASCAAYLVKRRAIDRVRRLIVDAIEGRGNASTGPCIEYKTWPEDLVVVRPLVNVVGQDHRRRRRVRTRRSLLRLRNEGEERLAGRGKKAWSFKCTKKNQDKEEAAEKEDEEAGVSRF